MSVSVTIENRLALVTIDNPPVNAIGHDVRAGLMDAVRQVLEAGAPVVILRCAGRTFSAGADAREFGQPPREPHLPEVLRAIESSPAQWIAALHGTVLGGGLELALACAHRVAVAGTLFGFPEVTLGLIPGAGGTVRLPRLVPAERALEMISGGRPVDTATALKIGLVDAVTDGDLTVVARELAAHIEGGPIPVPLSERAPVGPAVANEWPQRVKKARASAKGQLSVLAAVDAVERALTQDADDALAAERAAFLRLKDSSQSAALRHVFFAERSVSRVPGLKGRTPRCVDTVGVIGGGTMGSGIAAACLMAGLSVVLVERDGAALEAGQARVRDILAGAEKRGKLSAEDRASAEARFRRATDMADLSDADLVIEAVFEDMDVKRDVLAALDDAVRPDAILATNTSYLDVAALGCATRYPDRVIGLHFFSPAHIMKLLEVVTPEAAAPDVIVTALAFGKRLGKIAVPAGVCDGFIGNRIMSRYRREADLMIEDGALPLDVDAAMRGFGFPIGIFQMQDLAGLDIAWAMRKRRAATRDPAERYVEIGDRLCEAGRFGRKTGRGWYDYREDKAGAVDPEVTELIKAESARRGIRRRAFDPDAIMARILAAMQSEGRAVLEEGIAATPEAIDVVMVNGYGFPRWRGGPMFMVGNG